MDRQRRQRDVVTSGTLVIDGSSGSFTSIELRPTVVIVSGDEDTARALHDDAHRGCYIAGSMKSAGSLEPVIGRHTRRNDT